MKSSGIIGDAYRHSHTQLNHALPSLSVHARAWRGEMNAESDGACEAVTARRSLVELVQFHACTTTPQTAMELGLEFGRGCGPHDGPVGCQGSLRGENVNGRLGCPHMRPISRVRALTVPCCRPCDPLSSLGDESSAARRTWAVSLAAAAFHPLHMGPGWLISRVRRPKSGSSVFSSECTAISASDAWWSN